MNRHITSTLALALALSLGACSSQPRAYDDRPGDLAKALKLAEQGEKQADEGELEAARRLYVRSLAIDPDQHSVWNNLGVVLLEQDNLIDANRAFARAAAIEPRESRPHENMGTVWLRVEPREAIKHFERALKINPGSIAAMRGLIQARQRSNAPANVLAIETITNAMLYEQDPEWTEYFRRERSRLEAEIANKRRLAGETR